MRLPETGSFLILGNTIVPDTREPTRRQGNQASAKKDALALEVENEESRKASIRHFDMTISKVDCRIIWEAGTKCEATGVFALLPS